MWPMSGTGPATSALMFDRSASTLEDMDILEERPAAALSDAETAACTCPELCIRDHEYE